MASPAALELSRWQFAITAIFHMSFPALTVGLSVLLAVVQTAYLRTGNPLYQQIFRFWRKIFAVGFGLGVVAGTVMTFEFGLNWGIYAHAVGPVIGVTIGMEVITAFFLEAGFIGIMLYGEGRVRPRTMALASWMVAFGTLLSTTWILSAHSWMQDPVGYTQTAGGQFQPHDWIQILFNPAFAYRFPHMLLAVLISASWFVGGISAWYLVKQRTAAFPLARRCLSIALGVLALLMPIQLYVGDLTAVFDGQHQPAKLEAFEGNWRTDNNGYNLVVVPDTNRGTDRLRIEVPHLGAAIGHDLTGQAHVPGLLQTPPDQRPNMWSAFYGFRTMYFTALAMFATAMAGLVLRLRRRLFHSPRFLRWMVWMTPAGIIAITGGWITAETGRQPWVVYGKLRTADALSHLTTTEAALSLVGFVALYASLLLIWVRYIVRTVKAGPEALTGATAPRATSSEAIGA
ncbi:cytochrome ubiquinol oxidase subunit I [Streptacidiphilus fuscans]|uniref:Cytochrome ubiquinol oxidase subunit I n=1 Tax=Streptacidiphilus fuscans TaxID=2789292 RepID=A0A931B0Z7_9ACTN|nr:cytochrome ubiquinol oxidase subunit I [Streptacidiphilus fuscans]MBF9066687.1 cytochrome ubiquinol oxidase subunit I [Streptacidiphilus fuscans]